MYRKSFNRIRLKRKDNLLAKILIKKHTRKYQWINNSKDLRIKKLAKKSKRNHKQIFYLKKY